MCIPSNPPAPKLKTKAFLWLLIAVYTFLLPNARIIYNAMVVSFGQETAGKVPLAAAAIVGCMYAAAVLLKHRNLKNLLFLAPCALIAYLIMRLVDNPNKHIHIPEYVLMAWLLFAVLSKEYRSKDIYILIFIYVSLLGVVDELEQGIYPTRFYGWIDMAVNSASGVIGIFTIMGLNTMKPSDWKWAVRLKEKKGPVMLILFGFTGAAIMCAVLFQVQDSGEFRGVYPAWLWIWNLLFLLITPEVMVSSHRKWRNNRETTAVKKIESITGQRGITLLWTTPMLVILFYMHALLIFASISGMEFA